MTPKFDLKPLLVPRRGVRGACRLWLCPNRHFTRARNFVVWPDALIFACAVMPVEGTRYAVPAESFLTCFPKRMSASPSVAIQISSTSLPALAGRDIVMEFWSTWLIALY